MRQTKTGGIMTYDQLGVFEIHLTFDSDGSVSGVEYSVECGYIREFGLKTSIEEVIQHHLTHCRQEHGKAPQARCAFTHGDLQCQRPAWHGDYISHYFEM
jgi:hypothetical protein